MCDLLGYTTIGIIYNRSRKECFGLNVANGKGSTTYLQQTSLFLDVFTDFCPIFVRTAYNVKL